MSRLEVETGAFAIIMQTTVAPSLFHPPPACSSSPCLTRCRHPPKSQVPSLACGNSRTIYTLYIRCRPIRANEKPRKTATRFLPRCHSRAWLTNLVNFTDIFKFDGFDSHRISKSVILLFMDSKYLKKYVKKLE
jgi:hypothetical protein